MKFNFLNHKKSTPMDYRNLVLNAVIHGKLPLLQFYLENNDFINVEKYVNELFGGQTMLLIAIKYNHLEIIEYLITQCRADIEQTGNVEFDGDLIEGANPLWIASALGKIDIVKLLVSHGAKINSLTKTKSTPLRAACFDNHFEIVKYLVENGADIELVNWHGHTCLMIACFKKNYKIAKYLIEHGADVNKKTIKGNTALHDCSESGSLEILKLLIDHDAKMVTDSYNITPLLNAALHGNEEFVKFIIDKEKKHLCTEIEKINALELLGATFIDRKRDITKAIRFWKLAMHLRKQNINKIINKNLKDQESKNEKIENLINVFKKKLIEPSYAYDYAQEFTTIQELNDLNSDPDQLRIQALLVRERIIGPKHPDTSYYIRYRGAVYADSGNFDKCFKLWMYALEMQQKFFDPLSPLTQSSLFSFAELFSYMIFNKIDLLCFEEVFAVFQCAVFELQLAIVKALDKVLKCMSTNNCSKLKNDVETSDLILSNTENEDLFNNNNANFDETNNLNKNLDNLDEQLLNNYNYDYLNFYRTLIVCLQFMYLLCELMPILSQDQIYELKKLVYRLVKLNPNDNLLTLLHLTCYRDLIKIHKLPIYHNSMNKVVELLIEVGADVNAIDYDLNTPLHIEASASEHTVNKYKLKLLIENGAHLDAKNAEKLTPLDFLKTLPKGFVEDFFYPMKHLTLQCLCAQVIAKNNINYEGLVSQQMVRFIKIH